MAKRRKAEEAAGPGISEYVQYHCNYCRKDISNCVRICCAVCAEFDLCVECFSVGVELDSHKNDHDFRIIDNMHFPFLSEDWGADEEQLLLEGLELYGYGNWEDVAEHVTTKTKQECEEHYVKYYLGPPDKVLPDLSHVLSTREDVIRLNASSYPKQGEGGLGKLGGDAKPKAAGKPGKPQQSLPVKHEMANFMPFRGEFEIEWDNDAEMSIKDIEFYDDDSKEERDTKMRLLEIYNFRLDEREERRKFVVDRQLHDVKKMQQLGRKQPLEEKQLYARTRKLATFTTPEEYETFVRSLLQEKQLRQRIQELQTWREKGIRSFADGEAYRQMMNRQKMMEADKARGRGAGTRGLMGFDKNKKGLRPGEVATEPQPPQPGFELLSDPERKLCSSLELIPDRYLQLKTTYIREYLSNGQFNKQQAKTLTKVEPSKAVKVFEFMEECGWINKSTANLQAEQPPAAATPQPATAATAAKPT